LKTENGERRIGDVKWRNMEKFRFRKWKVYNDSQELFSIILKIVKELPKEFRFEIGSQMIRAALSVALNIAEGSGKTTDKELNRFLNISLGSLYETIAALDALKINGMIQEKLYTSASDLTEQIASQLGGLKKKLKC